MNFNNIGASTLQESNAFKKVRMFSKVYTTNLVHTPSTFTDKYVKLNSLYLNENDLNNSFNYGLKRQHNLTSSSATTNTFSTFLDKSSMDKFLSHNLQFNTGNSITNDLTANFNLLSKKHNLSSSITNTNKLNLLFQQNNSFNNTYLKIISLYPNINQEMNDDSDKKTFHYPLRKLFNNKLSNNGLFNRDTLLNNSSMTQSSSLTYSFKNDLFFNKSTTSKVFSARSSNQSLLPSERNVRAFSKIAPNMAHYNLSSGFNNLDSNMNIINNTDSTTDLNSFYFLNNSN